MPLGPRRVARGVPERVEPQRPIALHHRPARGRREGVGGPLDLVPAAGAGLDPVANGAPQEPIDGDAERLADQVPAGDFNPGQRRGDDRADPARLVPKHSGDQPFGLERVGADDMPRPDRLQERPQRPGPGREPRLAEADEPFIRPEPDEDQVTPGGPECEDVEIGDAHAVGLLVGSPARATDGVFFPAAPGRTLGSAASA